MDSAEMGRKRWAGVSAEERSRLTKLAVAAREKKRTKQDRARQAEVARQSTLKRQAKRQHTADNAMTILNGTDTVKAESR